MSRPELKAIRQRCDAATEGPWERYNNEVCNIRGKGTSCIVSTHRWGAGRYRDHLKCHGDLPEQEHQDNCDFVAHARQDIPDLLDEIERLEKLLKIITGDNKDSWPKRVECIEENKRLRDALGELRLDYDPDNTHDAQHCYRDSITEFCGCCTIDKALTPKEENKT